MYTMFHLNLHINHDMTIHLISAIWDFLSKYIDKKMI